MNAEAVTKGLGGRWSGHSGIARCPAHEDRSPSLSIAKGRTGQLLLTCHAGCSFEDVLSALRCRGLAGGRGPFAQTEIVRVEQRKEAERTHNLRRAKIARSIWRGSEPVGGTLAETYLRNRGISCPLPASLRYARECWHPAAKRLPALVGNVTGCDLDAVHRTYLRHDGTGKTEHFPSKAMLGATKGGAVRLSDSAGRLVVTEGIETGLSLLSGLMHGPLKVWAALSASGMKALHLRESPGDLVIAPDGDTAGRSAAQALAQRAYAVGWRVSLLSAPDGYDWNDVLTGKVKAP